MSWVEDAAHTNVKNGKIRCCNDIDDDSRQAIYGFLVNYGLDWKEGVCQRLG